MNDQNRNILITGISSGLGYSLAEAYLKDNWQVYGLSRRTPMELVKFENLHFLSMDLQDVTQIPEIMVAWPDMQSLDLVILNAGVLGKIEELQQVELKELQQIMDVNVWANKVLLDTLFQNHIVVNQVIAISSGAAVNGNKGWGGYAISKAALNMLIKLYAEELPQTHFTALAPGLIDTAMQEYISTIPDPEKFPSMKRLRAARNTPDMPTPEQATATLIQTFPKLQDYTSGSFVDIRNL